MVRFITPQTDYHTLLKINSQTRHLFHDKSAFSLIFTFSTAYFFFYKCFCDLCWKQALVKRLILIFKIVGSGPFFVCFLEEVLTVKSLILSSICQIFSVVELPSISALWTVKIWTNPVQVCSGSMLGPALN